MESALRNVAVYTFGSLFAGVGGLDLGMDRVGFHCKWQVEIEEFCASVLAKHWPTVDRHKDVKQFPPHPKSSWLMHRWKERYGVDVVCAGFPCTDISNAGKQQGLDGERSGLFFEVIRVARELRPRAILLENVSALLVRGLDRVLGALAEIGYYAEWTCIPAAAVGAPHIRDRIFILAYSDDTRLQGMRIEGENQERQDPDGYIGSSGVGRRDFERLAEQWAIEPAMGELVDGVSGGLVRFAGRTAYRVPNRVRKLKALGNAVVPQVGEFAARILMNRLKAIDRDKSRQLAFT